MSPDSYISTGQGILGFNMFAYCNNNPICFSDSEGNRPLDSLSVQSETKEQRELSFKQMNPYSTPISDSSTQSRYVDLNSIIEGVYNYINDFCDVLINSAEITIGAGIGYGGAFDVGEAGFEGFIYFNPMNITQSINSSKTYSSFYFGGNIEFLGVVFGPEIHLIFDWTTMSFINVSEDLYRFADLDFGVAYYKGGGVIANLTFK